MDATAAGVSGDGYHPSHPTVSRSQYSHAVSQQDSPEVDPSDWLSTFGLRSIYNRCLDNSISVSRNSVDAIKSRLYFPTSACPENWHLPDTRPHQPGHVLAFDHGSPNKEAPEPVAYLPNHLPVVKPLDLVQFHTQNAIGTVDHMNLDTEKRISGDDSPENIDSPATVCSVDGQKGDSECHSLPTNATSLDCEDVMPDFTADAVSVDDRSMTSDEAKDALLESQIGEMCSRHAPDFVSAVRARVEGANSPIPCTLGKRMCGGFNVAMPVQFADGVKWLLKIPKDGHGNNDRWTEDSAAQLRQSALTQRLVRAKTAVPTPEIYEFDSSKDNDLGYPYVLMEFVEGRSLYELLRTIYVAEHNNHSVDCGPVVQALHDVSRAMCQLDSLSFDKIGAPVIADDLSLTGETKPFWNLVGNFRAGPFDDLRSYMAWRLDAHYHDYENKRIFWARLFSMWICEAAKSDTFSLYHPDLNANNILVDDSGCLKAIIDWDFAQSFPSCMGKYSFPDFLVDDFQYTYGVADGPDECQHCNFQWAKNTPSDTLDGMASIHERADYLRAVWRYCVGFYSDSDRDASQTLNPDDLRSAIPTRYANGLAEASCVCTQGILNGYGTGYHLIDHLVDRIWTWEMLRPSLLGPEQWTQFPSVQRAGVLPGAGETRNEDDSTGAKLTHVPRLDDMDWVVTILQESHGKIEHHYVELIKRWFHYALWFPRFHAPRSPAPTPSVPRRPAEVAGDCGIATVLVDAAPPQAAPVPCPSAALALNTRPALAAFEAELASLDSPGLDARLALGIRDAEDVPPAPAAGGSGKRARAWKWAGRAARWMFG